MQSCGETSLYVVAVVRKKAMRAVRRREVVEEGDVGCTLLIPEC